MAWPGGGYTVDRFMFFGLGNLAGKRHYYYWCGDGEDEFWETGIYAFDIGKHLCYPAYDPKAMGKES